jgi:hypothetical protein
MNPWATNDRAPERGASSTRGASRRDLLKTFAAAGVGALVPAAGLIAQSARPPNEATVGRIDVHNDALSWEVLRALDRGNAERLFPGLKA